MHHLAAVLLWCVPLVARAQAFPEQRPGDLRPELPDLEDLREGPALELPPLPEPGAVDRERLSRQPRIVVREFRVSGSTVFAQEDLQRLAAPYAGRPVSSEELQRLSDEITLLYVNQGYVNSGAILPDQEVIDGVVEIRVVEGRLVGIEISGHRWLRTSTLRRRLAGAEAAPLRVQTIEEQLQILQQDDGIRRVQAELVPGQALGEAILRVRVEEEIPVRAWLDASNHEPPSVGAYRGRLRLVNQSLTRRGDRLELIGGTTGDYHQAQSHYEIPLGPWETGLGAWFRYNTSEVVEEPFDAFDIGADSWTLGLGIRQPVHRSLYDRIDLWLAGEYRRSETFLFGEPFSLGDLPASDDGRARLTALRIGGEWTHRDLVQALALRSQLSVGLPVLGATRHGSGSVPDGRFVAWLGQLLWARRFDPWGIELVFRSDLQLASSALLSIEQFSVGGHASVPGYRENELVRDDAVVASLETRLPLWRGESSSLQLAPFAAVGHAWNTKRGQIGPSTLASVGVGLRFAFARRIEGAITWGHRLRELPEPPDRDLQDHGVQFEVVFAY